MTHFDQEDQERLPIPTWIFRTITECVQDILAQTNTDVSVAQHFFQKYQWLLEKALNLPCTERLHGLHQFGIKHEPSMIKDVWRLGQTIRVATAPYIHTRHTHSKMVAAFNIVLGIRLGLSDRELAILALTGIFHDLGHLAYGHDAEQAIRHTDHETRGHRIVMTDKKIAALLDRFGINPTEIIEVLHETGRLGAIENLADSLAYVVLDSDIIERPLPDNFVGSIVDSVVGLKEDGRFVVTITEPLMAFLETRAELYRLVYETLPARFSTAALQLTLRHTVRAGIISEALLEEDSDGYIEMVFSRVFNSPQGRARIPLWIHSSRDIAHGFYDELAKWEVRRFDDELSAQRWLNSRPVRQLPSVFVVPAVRDFTRKKIPIEQNESPLDLRAPAKMFSEEFRFWYVVAYRNC